MGQGRHTLRSVSDPVYPPVLRVNVKVVSALTQYVMPVIITE